jgi:hypothetical protein
VDLSDALIRNLAHGSLYKLKLSKAVVNATGRARVGLLPQLRTIHLPILPMLLTTRLRDGTGHISMNSISPTAPV